jgi:hypothetical protein
MPVVVFTPVNEAMGPAPTLARPIVVFVFVQLNVVPVTTLVNVSTAVGVPLHTAWLPDVVTFGVGLTR